MASIVNDTIVDSTVTITIPATTSGDTLLIYYTEVGGSTDTPTIADNLSSPSSDYTLLDKAVNTAFTQPIWQFVRLNVPAGITSITVNGTTGSTTAVWVRQIRGVSSVLYHSFDAGQTTASDTLSQTILSGDVPAFACGFGFGSGYGSADVTASGTVTQDAQGWYKGLGGNYRGVASHQSISSSGTCTVTTNETVATDYLNTGIVVFSTPLPTIAQKVNNEGPNPPDTSISNLYTVFPSGTLTGNTIVAFVSASDFSGVKDNVIVIDSSNNGYTKFSEQNTSQSGGSQSLWLFASQNVAGNATPANVNFTYGAGGGSDNFETAYILDIGNVIANSVIYAGGNTQNALAPGTNNLNSGPAFNVLANQVPCLMIALAFNTSSSGSNPTPTVGTGMTLLANIWAFSGATNGACIATQTITTPGSYQALFNQASSASEDCSCVALILQGVGGAAPIANVFKMYANGAIQANAFIQSAPPGNILMRFYGPNNAIQVANINANGGGYIKLLANGQLVCNNTIIV